MTPRSPQAGFALALCSIVLAAGALASCGNAVSPGDGGGGGDASPDASAGVQCTSNPVVFPMFAQSCGRRDDCVVAIHQTDCCGNTVALGIRSEERPRFDAAERTCRGQYPGCGCPSMGTRADDGNLAFDPARVVVDCVSGRCFTRVNP